jgi:hypothetical protein
MFNLFKLFSRSTALTYSKAELKALHKATCYTQAELKALRN